MAADSIESKSISLSIQNGTIQTFVSEIEKQTDYMFLYKNEDIDSSIKVNVKAENKPAIEVLNEVIAKTNLVYKINGKHIVLTRKGSADVKDIVITGKIVDNKGEAIIGANVLIKGTSSGVVSDMDGNFSIKAPNEQSVLIFSYVGYVNQEIQIGTRRTFSITLQESSLEIDELVVTALGMKRSEKALGYATQKVSGEEFEKVKAKENGAKCSVDAKADNDVLRKYMAEILPEYDRERVYPSDIRKLISWYNILINSNFTSFVEVEKSTEKEEVVNA